MKEKIKKILNKKWDIPGVDTIEKIISTLSIAEKVFFYGISLIFMVSGLVLLKQANDRLLIPVPANGGFLKEGIIGFPRFVNPVLAVSEVDKDLTALIYSGLMRTSVEGRLETDLAQSYNISKDGLEYTFTLKDDIIFQDGTPITADDVEFTIKKIQDAAVKSPKRPGFYDVKIEKINDKQIKFVLKKPYSPFIENLTIGIIPKHIWNNLDTDQFPQSQYNVEPVGSGEYKVSSMQTLQKNMLIVPTYYELTPFNNHALSRPFINKMIVNFYRDEKTLVDAYNKGEVEAINSISPEKMQDIKKKDDTDTKVSPLPRVYAVFLNQNQSEALSDKAVRQALNITVDREIIVKDVLLGYGDPLYGPIPKGLIDNALSQNKQQVDYNLASSTLAKAGWKKNPQTGILEKKIDKKKTLTLSFSISTLNSPGLAKAAEIIKGEWEKLGAQVEIKQFEFGDLQSNVIRPRKYDALLYGEVIGRDMDFYAFWHSSQRNDPGINVAMYTNSKVDKLLEDARSISDFDTRIEKYKQFESEIIKDTPAIFLYSPEFIYITSSKVKSDEIGTITLPFERFLNINNWYIETNNIWKIFE